MTPRRRSDYRKRDKREEPWMSNRAAEIHAGLKHPVIDGDGHWLEPVPVFLEYLCEVCGAPSVDRMKGFVNAAMLHTCNDRASSRVPLSSKRSPMSWAWKEH